MRFISVVMGAESNRMRFQETAHLLGAGFAQLRQNIVLAAGSPIPGGVPVKGGRKPVVDAVAAGPLAAILPSGAKPPDPVLVPKKGLLAPVAKGDTVGVVELRLDEGVVIRTPVVASASLKKATVFQVIGRFFGGGS